MTTTQRPNIFPALRYKDAHAAIDWLIRVFGFEKQGLFEAPDGSVAHAELSFGAGGISINSAGPADPKNPWSAVRQGLYIVVTDPDASHARAKDAGAEIVQPLRDLDYGSREFSARDLDGHLWGFGTYDMTKTPGEPTIVSDVRYRNGRAAMTWLEKAFGFRKTFEVPGPDGPLVHGEMKLGDGAIYVEETPADPKHAALWGDDTHAFQVHLADPDAHHARAKAGGATIVSEPASTAWARSYCARDPEGFLWGFTTYRPAQG